MVTKPKKLMIAAEITLISSILAADPDTEELSETTAQVEKSAAEDIELPVEFAADHGDYSLLAEADLINRNIICYDTYQSFLPGLIIDLKACVPISGAAISDRHRDAVHRISARI